MRRLFLRSAPALAALAVLLLGTIEAANAQLTFYSNRADFDAANPGLPVEGFQNARTGTAVFTGPLNSSTNNASFQPGDILPGITILDNPASPSELYVAGPGLSANPTTAVGSNAPGSDTLDILFSPGVSAAAFDVFQNFGSGAQSGVNQTYEVQVFGASGLLGSTTISVPSGSAGFFGVSSASAGAITRVNLVSPVFNQISGFETIDNVAFGTAQPDTTPPTITASADKTTLWPPNGKLVPVTVTGQITDESDIESVTFTVEDEYNQVEPEGSLAGGEVTLNPDGTYSFTVLLPASRLGTDKDGRTYTIHVTATDIAGNSATESVQVVVPHDQGKK